MCLLACMIVIYDIGHFSITVHYNMSQGHDKIPGLGGVLCGKSLRDIGRLCPPPWNINGMSLTFIGEYHGE